MKKLPSIKSLKSEIAVLTSTKNDRYNEYRESKKQEKELQIIKDNIEKMLRQQDAPIREEKSTEI